MTSLWASVRRLSTSFSWPLILHGLSWMLMCPRKFGLPSQACRSYWTLRPVSRKSSATIRLNQLVYWPSLHSSWLGLVVLSDSLLSASSPTTCSSSVNLLFQSCLTRPLSSNSASTGTATKLKQRKKQQMRKLNPTQRKINEVSQVTEKIFTKERVS